MTLISAGRASPAEQTLDLVIAVVKHIRKMCRGAPAFACPDSLTFQDQYGSAFPREEICGRKTGNSRAQYAYISLKIFLERFKTRNILILVQRRLLYALMRVHVVL